MNSFAFLAMIGCFAGVAAWYVLNVERLQDGAVGFLAIKRQIEDTSASIQSKASAIRFIKAPRESLPASKAPLPKMASPSRLGKNTAEKKWHYREKQSSYRVKKQATKE
ncbi:MAG: hypothetical protein ACWA5L_08770 [bacterium]